MTEGSNITANWLGLGTEETWHGYPDARIRTGISDLPIISAEDGNQQVSPGNSLVTEAKLS